MDARVESALKAQLAHTLSATDFPTLGQRYQGKVRDTYRQGDRLVLITTDRLSAFDHVLTTLPFKGDLLNQLAHFWFQKTAHVVKSHVLDMPDPCVTVARAANPFPVEMVVRGYLTGSLWRDYEAGHDHYQLRLPPGLRRDQRFERPLLTPSTKAPVGQHDEPLPAGEVVARGLVPARHWARAREVALALFAEGQRVALERGLILVDTKYELGLVGEELIVIDEMHTPDSSRYWMAEGSEARFEAGQAQVMLDKENLRQWLLTERGFSGHGPLPTIPDEVRVSLAKTYVTAFERITGTAFAGQVGEVRERLRTNLRRAGLLPRE
jgi:phosphoribosylaminoimidazole-succinocarboxamide synthase